MFGADVISRMEASLEGKADKLAAIVREAVSCLLTELAEHAGESAEAIETVIITGNTSMLYFLTQKDPRCLSRAPFEADELFGWWTIGEALDLSCRKADVYLSLIHICCGSRNGHRYGYGNGKNCGCAVSGTGRTDTAAEKTDTAFEGVDKAGDRNLRTGFCDSDDPGRQPEF